MLAELRQLDPRPGRAFEAGPVEAVVPDVFVREGPAATGRSSSMPTCCRACWSTAPITPRVTE